MKPPRNCSIDFPSAEVWNTYGPTEATVATTSIRVDREVLARHAPLPVGYVDARHAHRRFVDENARRVPEGERGEIVIIGPNVSPGYLGRADLTEKAFFATDGTRAYRTGDWGRTREGLIFFEGRMDGQIKLHGYRIETRRHRIARLRSLPHDRRCRRARRGEGRQAGFAGRLRGAARTGRRLGFRHLAPVQKATRAIGCPITWCRENSGSWRPSR